MSYLFYNVYVHNQHTEMELSFDENVATAPLDENSDIYIRDITSLNEA